MTVLAKSHFSNCLHRHENKVPLKIQHKEMMPKRSHCSPILCLTKNPWGAAPIHPSTSTTQRHWGSKTCTQIQLRANYNKTGDETLSVRQVPSGLHGEVRALGVSCMLEYCTVSFVTTWASSN